MIYVTFHSVVRRERTGSVTTKEGLPIRVSKILETSQASLANARSTAVCSVTIPAVDIGRSISTSVVVMIVLGRPVSWARTVQATVRGC